MRLKNRLFKRITACVLALSMVTSLPEVAQGARINNKITIRQETASEVTLGNSFVTLSVSKKNGGYTLKTSEGDVLTKTDNNKRLLYNPDGDATSFATVRIDGTDYIYGNENEGRFISKPHIEDGNTVVSTYAISEKNVTVTQQIRLLMDSADNKLGAVQINYTVKNTKTEGTEAVNAGLRMVLDTCLGAQDYAVYEMAENGVNGTYKQYTKATEFAKKDIAPEFRAIDNNYAPRVAAYGYPDETTGKPDSMVFGHWFDMASNMWKFDVDESLSLVDNYNDYKTADSAVALFWNEKDIAAGAKSEYSFLYGISANNNVSESDTMQMTVRTDKDMFVLNDISHGENSAYEDNILNLSVKVSNTLPASKFRANVAVDLMVDKEYLQVDYNDVTDEDGTKLAVETNAGKDLIHITNFEVGQTKFINWKVHVKKLPPSIRYLKYALNVYEYSSSDNGNDYSYLDKLALCSAKGSILAPGYTGRKPNVTVISGSPEYLYYQGNRNFVIRGEGYDILKDEKTEWEMLLQNNTTGETTVVDSSRITFNSDCTSMIINFVDEMPVGQYQLIIKPGDALTDERVGLPERITSDKMKFIVSDDKNLVNPPVGGVAIKKVGKDAGCKYEIEVFNDAAEVEKLGDEYLLTFTGNLYRSNVNGVYDVPIVGDAAADDIIINRILTYSGSDFTIDYTRDKNGKATGIQVRLDGETGIIGGAHNLWGSESVIVLKNGRDYSLDKSAVDGGKANGVRIEEKGFAGALQKITGFVMDIDYGTFNRIKKDDKSYNTISFGGSLSLGFMSIDKYDGVKSGYKAGVNIDDIRYGEKLDKETGKVSNGLIGLLLNASIPVPQFINPMPRGLGGGLKIDTINYPYLVNVSGNMGLATFTTAFELEIIGSKKHGVPVPNIISLKVGGVNPGAPIIPPVVFLNGGEGKIRGLYSLFYPGEDPNNVPDTEVGLAGQISIVDVVKGWLGFTIGTRHASIYGKGLDICELPVLKSVSGDFTWYPDISFSFKATLELLNVINGTLSAKLILTGKKAPNLCLYGSCDVTLPSVLLGKDLTIAGVEVGGDKEKIYGSTTIMGVKMCFTITFGATGGKISVGDLVVPTEGTVDGEGSQTAGISNAELVGATDNDVNEKARTADKKDGASSANGQYYGDEDARPDVKVDEDGRLRILNPGINGDDRLIKVYYDLKDGVDKLEASDVEVAIDGNAKELEMLEGVSNIETANMLLGEDDKGSYILLTFKEGELTGKSELAVYSDKATVSYSEMFNITDVPEIDTITASINDDGTLRVDDTKSNIPDSGLKCTKVIYLGTDNDKYAYEIFGGQDKADENRIDISTLAIDIPGYVPSGSYYVTEVIDGVCNGANIHEEKTAVSRINYTNPNSPTGVLGNVTATAGGDSAINVSMTGFDPDTMDGVFAEAVLVDENGKEIVPDAEDIAEAADALADVTGTDPSGEAAAEGGGTDAAEGSTDAGNGNSAESIAAVNTHITAYIDKEDITNGSFTMTVNPNKEGTYYKVKVSPYRKLNETAGEQSAITAADIAMGASSEAADKAYIPSPSPATLSIAYPAGYITEKAYLAEGDESMAYTTKLYTEVPEGGLGIDITSDKPVMAKVYLDEELISDSTVYAATLPTVVLKDASGNPVADGEHKLKVVGKTESGDTSIVEDTIKLDTAGPLLQVFTPQAGDSVTDGKISISGMTMDGAELGIEVDGHQVQYDEQGYNGGTFNLTVDVPEETKDLSSHELKITVKDGYNRTNDYQVTVDDNRFKNITGVYLTVDGSRVNEGERVYIDDKDSADVALWAVMSSEKDDTVSMQLPNDMVEFENISEDSQDDITIDDDGKVTVNGEGTLALSARLYLTEDFCYQSNVILDSYNERMKDTDAVAPQLTYTDKYLVYTEDDPQIINVSAGDKLTLSASASFENEADEGTMVIEWFAGSDSGEANAGEEGSNSTGYTKIGEGASIEVTPSEDTTYFATATNTIRTTGIDTATASCGYKKVHVRHDITTADIQCDGTIEQQSDDVIYYAGDKITFKAADGKSLIGEYSKDGTIEWKNEIVKTNLIGGEQSFSFMLKDAAGYESKPVVYKVNIKNITEVDVSFAGTAVEDAGDDVKAYVDKATAKVRISNFDRASGVDSIVYEVASKKGTVTKNAIITAEGTSSFDIVLTDQGINTIRIMTRDADGNVIEDFTYTITAAIYKVPVCDITTQSSYTYNGAAVQFTDEDIITGGSAGEVSLAASTAGDDEYSDNMPVNAGEYDIMLTVGRDDRQYFMETSVVKTITVAKAAQVITFAGDNYTPEAGETITINVGGICVDDYDSISFESSNEAAVDIDSEHITHDKTGRTLTIPVKAVAAGNAVITVSVPGDDNYMEAVKTCTVNVVPAESDAHPYKLQGTQAANGWYISDVVLKPSEGYSVSASEDGEFTDSYSITGEGTERNPKTLYFKNSYGKIHPIDIETVNIDTSLPEAEIKAGESGWRKFLNVITFGLFFKENVVVEVDDAADAISGIDKTLYYRSDSAMDIEQLEELGDNEWSESSIKIEPDSKAVVYAKVIDKAGNYIIISTDGIIADKTPAIIDITSSDINGWITDHQAVVNVSVSDALADIDEDKITYSVDGGTVIKGAKNFVIENLEDGEHNVVINAEDKAGNKSSRSVRIRQDRQLPSVKVTEDKTDKKLIVTCQAGVSGVSKISFIYNGNETDITDTYEDGIDITYNGKYEVRLTTNAGITVNSTIEVTDLADVVVPTATPAPATATPVPTIPVGTPELTELPAVAPKIVTQPADISLTYGYSEGNVLSFQAEVPGDETSEHTLTYQWYSSSSKTTTNGTRITGANEASYTVQTGKNAGATEYYYCVVTATRKDNGQKASVVSSCAAVTIERAPVKVTAVDTGKTYGDAEPVLTARVTGLVNGENESLIKYTLSRKNGENAGNYDITPSGDVTQGNYSVSYVKGTFTIAKKAVTVTANNQTVAVGGQIASGAGEAALTGALNGHLIASVKLTGASSDKAGVYALTPADVKITDSSYNDVTGNYTIDYVAGTLIVQGAIVYVKQNSDGTWPDDAFSSESDVRSGRGDTYTVTKDIADRYSDEHYTLKGYSTTFAADGSGSNAYEGQTISLGEGVNTLYLYYELENVTLNFYEDTEGKNIWKSVNLRYGSRLSDYATADWRMSDKENDTFADWATEPNIIVDSYRKKNGSLNPALVGKLADWSGTITENMNVYPIWIHDRLAVKINTGADDTDPLGENQSTSFTVNLGEKITMRNLVTATRPGYELAGWYTQGGVLWNGENWKTLDYVKEGFTETAGWGVTPELCDKNEDGTAYIRNETDRKYKYYTITLTARWTPKKVSVEYAAGTDGTCTITDNGKYGIGDKLIISSEIPAANTGMTFIGWKLGDDDTLHSPGELFTFSNWSLVKDGKLTLTAQYMDTPETAISFDTDGGTAVAPIAVYQNTMIDNVPSTSKTGYTFEGWYDGENKVEFPYIASAAKTFKAHWKVNSYTVTFDSAGGTAVDSITQDYGTAINTPSEPSKIHYTFAGWHPALPDKMPAENMKVTADWMPVKYSINFDTDGGSDIAKIEADYGTAVTAPADPTRENYTFAGWLDKDGNIVKLPVYMPDTNPTYKAKWKKNQDAPQAAASAKDAYTVTVTEPKTDEEYIIVPAGSNVSETDWKIAKRTSGSDVSWNNLLPVTEYDVWVRRYETDDKTVSAASKVTVKTLKENQTAPQSPHVKAQGPNVVMVDLVSDNEEYAIVAAGEAVTDSTVWTKADENGEVRWSGLTANTSYDVYARIRGNDRQNPSSPSEKASVTTAKNTAEVTAPVLKELTYNGKAQELIAAGSTTGGKMLYKLGENGVYSEKIPTAADAGTYNVWYKVKGDDSHYDVDEDMVTAVIGRKAVTAAAKDQTVIYGKTITQNDTDYVVTGLAEGDTPVVVLSLDHNTNKINLAVTVKRGDADVTGNYNITKTAGVLKVTQAELTVTADNKEKIQGSTDPAFTYKVTGLVGNDGKEDVLTGKLAREEGENVGSYAIGQGSLKVADQYKALYDMQFAPAVMTIKESPAPEPTGEPTQAPEGTPGPAAAPKIVTQPSDLTLTYGYTKGNVLSVGVEVPGADAKNHTLSYQWYSCNSKTAATGTQIIGATDRTYTIPTDKNAGITEYYYCEITSTRNGSTQAAKITSDRAMVTVERASVTVTAFDNGKTYGDTEPILSARAEGLVNGDSERAISYTVSREAGENAGSYTITPSGDAVQGNYNVSYTSGTFTIAKKAAVVTANNQTLEVGGQITDGTGSASLTGALNNHSLSSVKLTSADTGKAGVYKITPDNAKIIDSTGNDVTDNYDITYTEGTLIVQGIVMYVKQNLDGTWPDENVEFESDIRQGRGDTYIVTEDVAGRYSDSHYKLKGYSSTYMSDGRCNNAYAGQTISLGEGINILYLYYELEDVNLKFYEDTEGTKVWKSVSLRYGARLSDYAADNWHMPDRANDTFADWATEPGIIVDSYRKKDGSLNPELAGKLADWSGTITSDMSVYPIWIHDRLAVKLDLGAADAEMSASQSTSFTVNLDEKITMRDLITATRPGYELAGWYTQGGVLWNGENWKTLDYVKEGYVEKAGWGVTPEFCDKNADGTDYIQTEKNRKYNFYTITLTARWNPVKATVEYDAGTDGTCNITDDSKYGIGNQITISKTIPDANTGKTFVGWKIGNDDTLHSPGETFAFNDWALTKDGKLTFTAQYIDTPNVAITFDSDGGTAVVPVDIQQNSTINTMPVTTKQGYTFEGWYDGEDLVEFPYSATAARTFKAHWKVNTYTITFDSAGGTAVDSITEEYGADVDVPLTPKKTHYVFAGWHPVLPDKMPAENLKVTADWTPAIYTISFDTDGGSSIEQIKGHYGSSVAVPADPTKENYTFAGWMDAKGNIVNLPSYMPDTDPSYKAKWKLNQAAPVIDAVVEDAHTVRMTDPKADEEYIIVTAGKKLTDNDWLNAKRISGDEVKWNNLLPVTEYDIWARKYETDDKNVSEAVKLTVTTPKEEQSAPQAPRAKAAGPNSIVIEVAADGEEYTVVSAGGTITDTARWISQDENGEVKWMGLTANTSYEVYARNKGNDKQNPSKPSDKTEVTTLKYTPEITAPVPVKITYDGKEHELIEAGTSSGGRLQYRLGEDGTYSENIPTAIDAGTYYVWYKVKGNKSYNDSEEAYVTVTVGRKTVTAVAKDQTATYGQTITQNEADYEVNGIAEGDVPAVVLSLENNTNKINISVIVKRGQADVTGNYDIARTFGVLTVNPAELTVTAEDKEKTAGEADPSFTYSVTGFIGNDRQEDVLTGTLAREAGEQAGTYEIGKGSLSVTEQYAALYGIKFTPGKLTIKASPTPVPTATPEPTEVPATAIPKATATPKATDKPTVAPASATPKATDKPTEVPATATPKATDKPIEVPATATPKATDKATVAPASEAPKATDNPTGAPASGTPNPNDTSASTDGVPAKKGTKLKSGKAEFIVTSSNTDKPEVAYSRYTGAAKKVSIPSRITSGGVKYTVTSIQGKAFAGNVKLKTIIIPKTVTAFGREVFAKVKSLKSVKIKCASLKAKNIKAKAFAGIGKKVVISVPKGKKNTYKKLFWKKGLNKSVKVK